MERILLSIMIYMKIYMLQERKKKSAEELLEMQEVIKKLKARMTEVCLDSDLK